MKSLLSVRSKGQALPEFVLVLPLILLIFFGVFDLGRAVYIYNTLSNAARQGARVASVNQSTTNGGFCDPMDRKTWSIVRCVRDSAVSLNLSGGANIAVCYYDSTGAPCTANNIVGTSCNQRALQPPCIARVTVTLGWSPITPIISDLVGTILLRSSSEMPVEAWYSP
jgi:TadE-like protein